MSKNQAEREELIRQVRESRNAKLKAQTEAIKKLLREYHVKK
jgi:hypothetical protein